MIHKAGADALHNISYFLPKHSNFAVHFGVRNVTILVRNEIDLCILWRKL